MKMNRNLQSSPYTGNKFGWQTNFLFHFYTTILLIFLTIILKTICRPNANTNAIQNGQDTLTHLKNILRNQ